MQHQTKDDIRGLEVCQTKKEDKGYLSETETFKEIQNEMTGFEEMILDKSAAPILQNKALLNKFTGSLHYITIANHIPYFTHNANNIKQIEQF